MPGGRNGGGTCLGRWWSGGRRWGEGWRMGGIWAEGGGRGWRCGKWLCLGGDKLPALRGEDEEAFLKSDADTDVTVEVMGARFPRLLRRPARRNFPEVSFCSVDWVSDGGGGGADSGGLLTLRGGAVGAGFVLAAEGGGGDRERSDTGDSALQSRSHSSGVMRAPAEPLPPLPGPSCRWGCICRWAWVSLQKMFILYWFRHLSLQ